MKMISPLLIFSILRYCVFAIFPLVFFSDMVNAMSQLIEPEPFSETFDSFFEKLPESRPLPVPPLASKSELEVTSSLNRQSKLFPYFLIQFPKDPCTNAGGTQHGVCVSAKDCRAARGIMVATCAQGFGACCRYIKSCGAEGGDIQVKENSTEIRSENGSASCRFILPKSQGICQVRVDFLNFQFGEALPTGDCDQTRVEITGGTVNFYNLCGNLTGQHFYINYGTSEKIYVYSGEPTSANDTFSIRISYIRCGSRQQVPTHCSQYYTGTSGQVRSLNWPNQQMNNQEYTVCIADPLNRRGRKLYQQTYQHIQWSTCGSSYYSGTRDFFISGKLNDTERLLDPSFCDNTDNIQIFGGNKQCGNIFHNETISSSPYLLRVRFDQIETTNTEKSLTQVQGYYGIPVNKPKTGCESLNTDETECVIISSSLCNCTRTPRRPNSKMENLANNDEGNTGFCLSYKIVGEHDTKFNT